jgi:hypothetical protein
MTTKDPADPADPLSATGIFLNAFRTQPEPVEEPARESFAPPVAANPAPSAGEFTQMFAAVQTPSPAPVAHPSPVPPRQEPPPQQPAEQATRIFVRQATPMAELAKAAPGPTPAAAAQRLKGFSAPGASDSASDDGSFSQFFRKIPAPQAPPPPVPPPPGASSLPPAVPATPKSFGATNLFGTGSATESPADRNARQTSTEMGSVTGWMRKLSEEVEPVSSTQIFAAPPSAPVTPPGPGEFTRIMSGDAMKAAREVPAAPAMPAAAIAKVQPPPVEPPKVAVPKLAAPAVSAPQTKLQQMLPILLVLNGFLLLVLIVLVVFVLLRK